MPICLLWGPPYNRDIPIVMMPWAESIFVMSPGGTAPRSLAAPHTFLQLQSRAATRLPLPFSLPSRRTS